ncbi:hypothetical protein [Actinospongicola halichondriae]|uniref:hypothetical protein n=1 Tax=Actinospongicola halichondriae TaxID=3236844 RepID=UPI003D5CB7C5
MAEIVDALHRQGIVHRRLDADHVAVSERGRPHLIGFGEAGDGDASEMSADVAALGAMLNRLLDDGADALWSPAHRGVRAGTRRRRAMAAFRTAAASAQRTEAAQRPSAHQLATAIGDALPGLTLPVPPGDDAGAPGPGGFAEIPHDIDPTDDLGWTDFDLSFLAVDDEVAPDDDIERNPAAPRDPYAVLESLASPDPDAATPVDGEDADPIIAALRAAMAAEEEAPEVEAEIALGNDSADDEDEGPEFDATAPTDTEPDQTEPDDPTEPDHQTVTDFDRELAMALGLEPEVRPDAAPDCSLDPDLPEPEAADIVPATAVSDGPEPIRLRPPSIQIRPGDADPTDVGSGPSRRLLIAVATVLLVLGAIAGSVIARAVDPFGAESASAAPDPATTTTITETPDGTDGRPTTPPPLPAGCTDVALAGPDGDGDGCPDDVQLTGRVATVGDVDVELGRVGDLVVIADSDCDGIATPVVLRPESGEVFAFPGWSLDEAIEVAATAVVEDAVSIGTGDDSACPDVVVTTATGDEIVVAP